MAYTRQHASALDMVRRKGVAVTFTKVTPGTYDAATDTWTNTADASVSGQAIRTKGDPERYRDLSLVASEAPTLLFVPTTFGEKPALGATVSWDSTTYTCRDVEPIAPDGTAIMCKVVVVR